MYPTLLDKNRNIIQKQAAELCGISASFYGNIERGTKKMSLDTFVVICDKLNLSPDYLLQDNLPDSDPIVFNIISEVKKTGPVCPRQQSRFSDL